MTKSQKTKSQKTKSQKTEAVKRLKKMKVVSRELINSFETENITTFSNPMGVHYLIQEGNYPDQTPTRIIENEMPARFGENLLPYFVIQSSLKLGNTEMELYSVLYVGDNEEDWGSEFDFENNEGSSIAVVFQVIDNRIESVEIGSIGLGIGMFQGVIRTW
ncbi:hypothetical protein [Enterococcus casseliflavus]|uniref:hypothetical protein n=1 Tax=Enterococcus casseliflavus TaxID=37734 RepID=UPI002892116C|nr:hypothetical protein [Enterococcus casseliflavus]MDT2960415.1 hypothetical protein [Enterococcus casseliflavus]